MAVRTLAERHTLRAHDTGGQQQRMFEVELGIRLPFPESLERLAQQLAVLKARQPLRGFLSHACRRCADDPAHRCEESGFTAVTLRFEEDMKRRGRGSPAALIRIESPTPPLRHQLIARQSTPLADGL